MKLLLTSLFVLLAAAAPPQKPKPTEVHVDNEPWHLELSLDGFQPAEGFPSSVNRQILTYRNGRGTMLSVIVENAHAPATLASCRRLFARRMQGGGGPIPVNEVQRHRSDASFQEYDLKIGSNGATMLHHNIYSCRVRGSYYIDVHASKVPYQPGDRDALMALVDSVRIVN